MNDIGVIAIGRNEGERLRRCLTSVIGQAGCAAVVYVDSNSSDGSVGLARALGADVVELDMSLPFSAARARNAGFERLRRAHPQVEFVQFIDGDCEVAAGWLEIARTALVTRLELAAVCGRRRERHPERSVYNRLADIEWDTPVGDARSCGGDAMLRAAAFRQVGGYDPSVIAGEEPEMCVRLRALGWKVARLDAEMTLHDADMTRFAQFWRRMVRTGHAFAEGAWMHGRPPERHAARETRSIVLWGLLLPLAIIAAAWPLPLASTVLAALYPFQAARVAIREGRRRKLPAGDAWAYAAALIGGKFPQLIGAMKFWSGKLLGRRIALIEYKTAAAHCPTPHRSPAAAG
jgi:GT2 family glycosyltransferase